nr:hypothetical protein [Tanacetum cinerariifolium]
MERGFLDSGDKNKKDGDGVKKDAMDEAANVGIAAKVKLIDGKLRKLFVVHLLPWMYLQWDQLSVGGEASNGGKHTPTKVHFRPITTSTVAIPAHSEGSYNGSTCEAKTDCSFASLVRPKESSTKVHFCAFVNDEKLESFDCVLPKAIASKYVLNTWRKFGFEKINRNDDGVYLFKFASKSGKVANVPVWVKIYNVPVLAYSEDGLSLIATQ